MLVNSYVTFQGFSPLSLPDLRFWGDASDASTVTEVLGAVSQWNDKSPDANHLVQPVTLSRFTYDLASINGLNAMLGAGLGDMLFSANITMSALGWYMFTVASNSDGVLGTALMGTTSANFYMLDLEPGGFMNASPQATYAAFGQTIAGLGAATTDGSVHLMGAECDGADYTINFDAVTATRAVTPSFFLTSTNGTPPGYQLDGKIGEIIIGNGPLTAQQIADTKAYLRTKWGTP